MIRTRTLHVMVSQTQTGIGRIIRAVSGYPYNHVSVTLDSSLENWYSFARYHRDAPFYSGFIRESIRRLCAETGDIQVLIFQVEIPEIQAARLEEMIPMADDPGSGLIYNHFEAAANVLGLHFPVPQCHTCLSFACHVLNQQHVTIASLCDALEPRLIYKGSLCRLIAPDEYPEDSYFQPVGVFTGAYNSTLQLGKLAARTVFYGLDNSLAPFFRRKVR